MKYILFAILIAFVMLTACAPAPTVTSIPRVTTTTAPSATPTLLPTATVTVTNAPTQTSTVTLTPVLATPTVIATPRPPTLRELADKLGIKVGTYIDPNARPWENREWSDIAAREFNLGVISTMWHVLIPKQDQFDFGLPDTQAKLARASQMEIFGATLVYSSYLPDWLKNGSFTRDQYVAMFQNYIQAIMNRYKGQVKTWEVVNEAGFIYKDWDFWEKHLGREYVELAFRTAREAVPSAILIYNDFGNETFNGPKYQQTKQIVDSLKAKGLIDGIGLQLHIVALESPTRPGEFAIQAGPTRYNATANELIEGMRSYGIPVHITELDVDLREIGGTDEQRFKLQAAIYRNVLDAALKSGVCKDITFWGFGDKYSWLEQPEFNGSLKAQPTLFDDNLNPKPAYFAVRDALSSK
jgi:endo-1,4-beta-xylanase